MKSNFNEQIRKKRVSCEVTTLNLHEREMYDSMCGNVICLILFRGACWRLSYILVYHTPVCVYDKHLTRTRASH